MVPAAPLFALLLLLELALQSLRPVGSLPRPFSLQQIHAMRGKIFTGKKTNKEGKEVEKGNGERR